MNVSSRVVRIAVLVSAWLGLAIACAFDSSLREYLDARFWLPFSKQAWHFEKKNVRRIDEPFAGMAKAAGGTPLAKLRAAYQEMPQPDIASAPARLPDPGKLRDALAAARADRSLTRRER